MDTGRIVQKVSECSWLTTAVYVAQLTVRAQCRGFNHTQGVSWPWSERRELSLWIGYNNLYFGDDFG